MSALSRTLLSRFQEELSTRADPAQAPAMAAYMRDQFPFLGLKRAQLDQAIRAALPGQPKLDEAELHELTLQLWQLPEREYQYVACGLLRKHVTRCGPGFLVPVRHLILTKSWWDTVDTLASHTVGPLVRAHPQLLPTMDEWAAGDELWLIRAAILHQLRHKHGTDAKRLFGYCAARAAHPDFFIRKAIGWALREYAKTDPEAVRAFVTEHESELSGLSKREALKNL